MMTLLTEAQENQAIKLQFDQSKISPQFTMPSLPKIITPATNIKPTLNTSLPTAADGKMSHDNLWTDSLSIYQQDWRSNQLPDRPRFRYDITPYGHDRSSSGVVTRIGNGCIVGVGSHTTFPGMGNMASASVAYTMPVGERLQLTAGLTGSKYHFDNNAWNDYGLFGNASYRLHDKLSLNAFGQYYVNQRYHSVAVMPFIGNSSYGGTLGWRASDHFSLDVGARRIYDPYTGTWRTLPIVQPTINVFGAPISFDTGPVIYQLLDGIFRHNRKSNDWGDPRYRPVVAPNAAPSQPGFNPNSPVPVPDIFRH